MTYTQYLQTPLGPLSIHCSESALQRIELVDGAAEEEFPNELTRESCLQLTQYFAGERQAFSIPLDPQGSDFYQSIWHQLAQLPYGATISYGELAKQIDRSTAVRAVATAVGRNPIPIIIPCHRIIRTGGALGGFAWGLPAKQLLLKIEGVIL